MREVHPRPERRGHPRCRAGESSCAHATSGPGQIGATAGRPRRRPRAARSDPESTRVETVALKDVKIVFTGPPNAGKTTAIAALSDIAPVCTDVRNTDSSLAKERTTVGLDFGSIDLGNGQAVRLFGTPGQTRFRFLWRAIAKDALGLVILGDNSLPDPLAALGVYLDAYKDMLATTNCVVGIGRMQLRASPS